MDEAKRQRRATKRELMRSIEDMERVIHEKGPVEFLDELNIELKASWEKLAEAHNEVMKHVAEGEEDDADKWLDEPRKLYRDIRRMLYQGKGETKIGTSKKEHVKPLQLKKMEPPKFSGDVKNYSQFKEDFQKFVVPAIHTDQVAFALRQSLSGEPLNMVKPAEDDVKEMWNRLDERYGRSSKLVDVIVGEIVHHDPIEGRDRHQLVRFINMVELGYRNLERMDLQTEMSNTRVVGEIERKLPKDPFDRWVRHIHEKQLKQEEKMKELLLFLMRERSSMEYSMETLRTESRNEKVVQGHRKTMLSGDVRQVVQNCLIHGGVQHYTEDCRAYKEKTMQQRLNLIKEKRACFRCLKVGHIVQSCRAGPCGERGCTRKHHPTIHFNNPVNKQTTVPFPVAQNTARLNNRTGTILMAKTIQTVKGDRLNAIFDSGATASVITEEAVKRLNVTGNPVTIVVTKFGGEKEIQETHKYNIKLRDEENSIHQVAVFGIPSITDDLEKQNTKEIANMFRIDERTISRPTGRVDILIGMDYAGLQPQRMQIVEQLMLCQGVFGHCVGGSHPIVKKETSPGMLLTQIVTQSAEIGQFLDIESMGVQCSPKCGGCRCGKCPLGAKEYTLQEERELSQIEGGMTCQDGRWYAEYPWIKDPHMLPDNRPVAEAKLRALEKRLRRDPGEAECYKAQVRDMLERGVAREVTPTELTGYKGPVHYIAHHGVIKADSASTPLRIVFNSSANYKGHILNDYWAKGPDLNNNLIGVLLRFRKEKIALVGDIKKMYHSVGIRQLDQQCHRFLWRDLQVEKPMKTYCVTAINFGDRPAATMAIAALHKTADMSQHEYPEAVKTLKENVYMDDVADSLRNVKEASERSQQIDKVLAKGGFKIKQWIVSTTGEVIEEMKVLGLIWKPRADVLGVPCNVIKQVPEKELTKRKCLSAMNSVFDPLGFLAPVTVRAKILLRKLWGKGMEWDTILEPADAAEWMKLFADIEACKELHVTRCIKPLREDKLGDPLLVMFSDASQDALGAVAYAVYPLMDGGHEARLIAAKSRVAPVRISSIVRLELTAAVLSTRLASTIVKENGLAFQKILYLVDSEIVRSMVQKQSYGFRTFVATRIGEIQQATDTADWYWVAGDRNVADIISRGAEPRELDEHGIWQNGPEFLKLPSNNWPISQTCSTAELPERVGVVLMADIREERKCVIDIQRFSSMRALLRVTAIIKSIYKNRSLKSAARNISVEELEAAKIFWVKEAQKAMTDADIERTYVRLGPKRRADGIIVVGDRIKDYCSYNQGMVPLLPYHHRFAKLVAEQVHMKGHSGIDTTMSKIRSMYWVVRLRKLVKSIRNKCVSCRKFEGETESQQMAPLPIQRLKPSPPWTYVGCDLFGPFTIKGEVQKRVRGKAYGVIFNCLVSRAVYLDLATDYSTEAFLKVFRRFTAIRGYPTEMFSDRGSQIVAACECLKEFGTSHSVKWSFSTPDSPWQNGVTESLIRGVKKSLFHVIGEQVLTFEELQTTLIEVTDVVNSRPIGRHPTDPEDGAYLCPNDLLLGRSNKAAPGGPWCDSGGHVKRWKFLQKLIERFWEKWTQSYFPTLIVRSKWHVKRRNLQVGDVVLIQEENVRRGKWKTGVVINTLPDVNGLVRNVEVQTVTGTGIKTALKRAVQRLVLLVPKDEEQ